MRVVLGHGILVAATLALAPPAQGGDGLRPPITLVSSSSSFDRACRTYYRQGNDQDVTPDLARDFCDCIAGGIDAQGLGGEVMDFLGRTYSEDLTAFIDEYPDGKDWMEAYFAAEQQCKAADYGANQPPEEEPNPPPGPIEAGSWGGIVRDGPGQQHRRIATLAEGERVMLLENTSIFRDGYPWWLIEFRGGRQGYQWGGILCSLDGPVESLYDECE